MFEYSHLEKLPNKILTRICSTAIVLHMSEPVLAALVFADHIVVEDNGKKVIVGTFTKFTVSKVPVWHPSWCIYGAITNIAKGDHPLTMTISHRESEEQLISINGVLSSTEPDKLDDVIEIVFKIEGITFEKLGKYDVSVKMDNHVIGNRIFYVDEVKQEK